MKVNIDFCGVVNLLRGLVREGKCTQKEARKIAARIAANWGVDIILFL